LPAAIFVAVHREPSLWRTDLLVEVLNWKQTLPAHVANNLEGVQQGQIYICPPDYHLSLEEGLVRVERSPKQGHFRPSIDVMFRSAAASYGRRVAAVLLTGLLDDGTAGLRQVKEHGGVTIVQDPEEAEFPSMPQSAIHHVAVDYVLPISKIAEKLVELAEAREPVENEA
jgi:two-component system chemotaxis response regulator CheB